MKQKLLTLMTLLLCAVSGAWADVDPTLDVEFTSSTKADWLKTYTPSGITLSGSGGFSSSSGYYYSGCSGNASDITGNYLGIAAPANKKISKVSIFVSPNNSNTVYPVFVGWAETATKTNVACYSAIEGTSKTNTKAGAEWITYDLGEVASDIIDLRIYRKVSAGNFYETGADKSIGNNKDLGAGVTLRIWAIKVWLEDTKVISTQTLGGVRKGSTKLTEGTDYTISSTTITLAEAYKAATAPTDVKLINHITYTDSSEENQDVDVTLAKDGDFFQGTATIGLTTYTVKVPVDNTPTLEADKASLAVISTKAGKGTATIQLTGANLTGDASVAFASAVDGLTITPATITLTDGAVNQTFTVTYQSFVDVAENSVNLTFTVGAKSVVIPITYSSTAAITTITDVSTAKEWDFSKAGSADIESPANGTLIPFANVDGFKSGFDYESLAGNAQYFYYNSNKAFQGIELKFHTTVAGYITVEFSNTGGGTRPYRHLYVNGVDTNKKSKTTDKVKAENIAVDAGDVSLKGMMENGDDPLTPNMLRIYKVVFVPSDPAPSVNISDKEWATYVTETAIDFTSQTNVEAFIVTGHEGTAITKTKVTSVPANTPVLLHALNGGGSYYSFDTRATSSTDVSGNKLKKGANGIAPESGKTKYVLSVDGEGNAAFKRITASADIPATKAYLQFDETIEAPLFDLDGETTSIKAVETKTVENGEYINLAGQRVAQPTKGLYIVNGKKVIIK